MKKLLTLTPTILVSDRDKMASMMVWLTMGKALKDRRTLKKRLGYLLVISMIVMRNLMVNKGILILDVENLLLMMIL